MVERLCGSGEGALWFGRAGAVVGEGGGKGFVVGEGWGTVSVPVEGNKVLCRKLSRMSVALGVRGWAKVQGQPSS